MTDVLAMWLAAAGLAAMGISLWPGIGWRSGLPIALELWTAAGLLRLCGDPTWSRIGGAAAIVAIRRLLAIRPIDRGASVTG